jgi:hypothetical protein
MNIEEAPQAHEIRLVKNVSLERASVTATPRTFKVLRERSAATWTSALIKRRTSKGCAPEMAVRERTLREQRRTEMKHKGMLWG